MSMSSGHSSTAINGHAHGTHGDVLAESAGLASKFKIVSTQSTAKPGAIIELEAICSETSQTGQSTLMLHAFQEQLILAQSASSAQSGKKGGTGGAVSLGLITSKMSAIVDLQQQTAGFCEPFYALVAENSEAKGVVVHMWRLVIASKADHGDGKNLTNIVNTDFDSFSYVLQMTT